jgi:hypothetical protein
MQPGQLPSIPLIDATAADAPSVLTARTQQERLSLLMSSARRTYTPMGLRWADRRTRHWHSRSASPYIDEVRQVDRAIGQSGGFLLNYSYEWGCTTGAAERDGNVTLMRTLDWPFDGLGRALIAVRQQGRAGPYVSISWPPLPLPEWGKAVGWGVSRLRVNR